MSHYNTLKKEREIYNSSAIGQDFLHRQKKMIVDLKKSMNCQRISKKVYIIKT